MNLEEKCIALEKCLQNTEKQVEELKLTVLDFEKYVLEILKENK